MPRWVAYNGVEHDGRFVGVLVEAEDEASARQRARDAFFAWVASRLCCWGPRQRFSVVDSLEPAVEDDREAGVIFQLEL